MALCEQTYVRSLTLPGLSTAMGTPQTVSVQGNIALFVCDDTSCYKSEIRHFLTKMSFREHAINSMDARSSGPYGQTLQGCLV